MQGQPNLAEAWLVRYRYRRRYHLGSQSDAELRASVAADLDRALDRLARWLAEGPDLARVASLSEERLASPPDPLPEGFSTG